MTTKKVRGLFCQAIIFTFFAILSQGCGIYDGPFMVIDGTEYSTQHVNKIQKNKTTKKEILVLFGDPYLKKNDNWIYYFLKERKSVDRRWIGIPIEHRQRFKAQLSIYFKNELVKDFNFEKEIKED